MYKDTAVFDSVTIFVLASNEIVSLKKTIEKIKENCNEQELNKIIIVLKSETCPSFCSAQELASENSEVELYIQKAATVAECLAELPPMAESSHFIIMASDLEMDPDNIKEFIARAKKNPSRIICAAKWLDGSVINGYGKVHEFFSRAMNSFISFLYQKKIKDPFSVYQIYPVSVYRKMNFSDPSAFLYEYTLKPMRTGVEYEEIPTVYNKRKEEKTNFGIITLVKVAVRFCLTAVKIRFTPMRYINENKQ